MNKIEKDYYQIDGKYFVFYKEYKRGYADSYSISYRSERIDKKEYEDYVKNKYNPDLSYHHTAIVSENIERSVQFYKKELGAEVLYQDDTWGLLSVNGSKIALVVKTQHPPHICFEITSDFEKKLMAQGKVFKRHRDGTSSCYISDPDGNVIEYLISAK